VKPPKRWLITDKGDQDVRALADRHYSRQTPGAPSFTRNGQNLVFTTEDGKAAWVTFRPTPGKAKRPDGWDAWECALFRNEDYPWARSSDLIREAVELSIALWGPPPRDGIITFVKPECIASELPGYCYRRAGWKHVGEDSKGKPRFRAPRCDDVDPWWTWRWKAERGGKLRQELTTPAEPKPQPRRRKMLRLIGPDGKPVAETPEDGAKVAKNTIGAQVRDTLEALQTFGLPIPRCTILQFDHEFVVIAADEADEKKAWADIKARKPQIPDETGGKGKGRKKKDTPENPPANPPADAKPPENAPPADQKPADPTPPAQETATPPASDDSKPPF
jgi:hypothetical protein